MSKGARPPAAARRSALCRALFAWFRAHRRDLPWRRRRTPYRVWISELMLQQTRADQVIPYYARFLKRFPDVRALARAPRAAVLKQWEGLGYYARAVRAHETARRLVRDHGGRFPATLAGLRALPGVGAYTAAAVGSLAFGLDAAVVDGNVARVLARLFGYGEDVRTGKARRFMQERAQQLLPPGRAGEFNEALMELGALVCTPRRPRCPACPWRGACAAFAQGEPERYPVAGARKRVPHKIVGAGIVVNRRGDVLIAQRHERAMLGGLWEFPGGTREAGESVEACIARELKEELDITVDVGPHLMTVAHAFSHFTMDLHAHWARLRAGRPKALHCAAWRWVRIPMLRRFAFGRADRHIVAAISALRTSQGGPAWPALKRNVAG